MSKTEDRIVESIEEKLKADRDENQADVQLLQQHHLFNKVQPLVTILRNNPELAERIVTLAMMLGLDEAYRQFDRAGQPLSQASYQNLKQVYGLGSLNVSKKLLGLDDDRANGPTLSCGSGSSGS